MFQKALKCTADHITSSLTKEIMELRLLMTELETLVDDIENYTANYTAEIENLKGENLTLQTRLEEYENRTRRYNSQIRGIPESVLDLQATMLALFQELLPAIPFECLEMDRVHRALTPKNLRANPVTL